jgi:hypothetical protein
LVVRPQEAIRVDADALRDTRDPIRGTATSPGRFALYLAAVGGFVVLAIAAYGPCARWLTRSRGEHLTLAEAQGRVRLDLPAGASDIRFYQHLHPDQVIVVDFAATEGDFLAWAAQQGWKPERVVGSVTIWPRSVFGDRSTMVTVTDGYGYHTLQRGAPNTFSVTYDRGTRRAYYQFSSEPNGGED